MFGPVLSPVLSNEPIAIFTLEIIFIEVKLAVVVVVAAVVAVVVVVGVVVAAVAAVVVCLFVDC